MRAIGFICWVTGTLVLVTLEACSGGDFGAGDRKPLGDASIPEAGAGHTGGSGSGEGGTVKSRGGARAAGGATSAGDGCIPQPCANDNATCGEIDDGCGGVAKCLHACGAAQACDSTAHRCSCTAADKCPKTLKNGESVDACCTPAGGCGVDYGTYGCGAVYSCTFVGGGGCGPSPLGGSMPTWACPGLDVGPDPSCTRVPGTPTTGATRFCCLRASYPDPSGAGGAGMGGATGTGGATSTEPCGGPCPYQDEGAASICPGKNLFIAMSCVSDKCVSNASEPNKNHWYCCSPDGAACTKI